MTRKTTVRERLNRIRMPKQCSMKSGGISAAAFFALGIVLGIISKWMDNLALDSAVRWHRWIDVLDLGNFFSDIAVWLFLALIIAAFSPSALRAALNVLLFFAGMCVAYHVYTVAFSGFDPLSYMMIWYGITLFSPILAVLCWYAKGTGAISIILDIGIIAVFFLACFSIGFFYIDLRGVLYLLVFCGATAVLFRDFKQFMIALLIGIGLAFLLNPIWPYH